MSVISNPIRIAWNNLVSLSDTTVSASSSVVSLPAKFVKNQIPTKVWRSTTITGVTFNITFASAKSVQQAAIRNHNLSATATITLQGATNSSFSPVAVSAGLTVADDILLWEFASQQTYQYWRFTVEDANNTDGYIEFGHIFLGLYDQFDFPDFATVIQLVDPSVLKLSYGGSMSAFKKTKFRLVQFGLSMIQQQDRRTLDSIYKSVGITEGLYLFLDPTNKRDNESPSTGKDGLHRMTIFGHFTGVFEVSHKSIDWHSVETLTLEELR